MMLLSSAHAEMTTLPKMDAKCTTSSVSDINSKWQHGL
jgi:hypothetical protein